MKKLFLSFILFSFGAFCDMCADFCTRRAEKNISQNKSLQCAVNYGTFFSCITSTLRYHKYVA